MWSTLKNFNVPIISCYFVCGGGWVCACTRAGQMLTSRLLFSHRPPHFLRQNLLLNILFTDYPVSLEDSLVFIWPAVGWWVCIRTPLISHRFCISELIYTDSGNLNSGLHVCRKACDWLLCHYPVAIVLAAVNYLSSSWLLSRSNFLPTCWILFPRPLNRSTGYILTPSVVFWPSFGHPLIPGRKAAGFGNS